MIDFPAVATVAAVYASGVVIPGPNFVAVTHRAVTSRRSHSLALVAGIVLVNLFWASSAILGVAAVFAVFPWISLAVKSIGAGYLIWFGLRLLLRSPTALPHETRVSSDRAWLAFRQGVAVNIVNPKSIAFYAAVFSAAAPKHVETPTFVAMLACVGLIAGLWYGAVALFFSQPVVSRWFERRAVAFNRTCGVVLVSVGVKQALSLDTA